MPRLPQRLPVSAATGNLAAQAARHSPHLRLWLPSVWLPPSQSLIPGCPLSGLLLGTPEVVLIGCDNSSVWKWQPGHLDQWFLIGDRAGGVLIVNGQVSVRSYEYGTSWRWTGREREIRVFEIRSCLTTPPPPMLSVSLPLARRRLLCKL